ncbi:tetratricopeptide repeat protein [Sphingomonas sp.]|uniref:tetratricopeptide repeat protein n=1 Tax=Sphingomonas sp. TaxID=28214 RepID=UPI003456AD72
MAAVLAILLPIAFLILNQVVWASTKVGIIEYITCMINPTAPACPPDLPKPTWQKPSETAILSTPAPTQSPSQAEGLQYDVDISRLKDECGRGKFESCDDLAIMYYRGRNISRDYSQAAIYFRKACDGGMRYSCFNLGSMYEDGFGVERDYNIALRYYERFCEQGYPTGCQYRNRLKDRMRQL